jgi:hypothetical protein
MIPYDVPTPRHEADAYFTPRGEVLRLLKVEDFEGPIWEPACGTGNISEDLIGEGFRVISSDLLDWGYGQRLRNFLEVNPPRLFKSLITNPPYELHMEFLERAAEVTPSKFAFLMRLQYMEGVERSKFYKKFHLNVWIAGRVPIEVNGTVRKMIPYAWYVFDLKNKDKRIKVDYLYGL